MQKVPDWGLQVTSAAVAAAELAAAAADVDGVESELGQFEARKCHQIQG